MAQTFFHNAVRDDRETEVVVEIAVRSWGCSAQTYGPAENCYPAEPMETEIVDCWLVADENKPDPPRIQLTDAERERIELDFAENPPEPDYGDDY